jgi:hypothetical protein
MANNVVVGVDAWGGRTKSVTMDHSGPASYTLGGEVLGQAKGGGPNVFGLAGFYSVIPCGPSLSGNYNVETLYGGTGVRSAVNLRWRYAGSGTGVIGVGVFGGSGMTPGTYPLVFSGGGGTGASGTITVTSSAVTAINLTSPGDGYSSTPTVTAATGGTPPTLQATIGGNAGGEVAAGTNLLAEVVRLMAQGG